MPLDRLAEIADALRVAREVEHALDAVLATVPIGAEAPEAVRGRYEAIRLNLLASLEDARWARAYAERMALDALGAWRDAADRAAAVLAAGLTA